MADPKQQLLEALEAAGAVEGTAAHLTAEQLVDRTDVDPDEIDDLLQALRFGDGAGAKGPDDQRRLRDGEATGLSD